LAQDEVERHGASAFRRFDLRPIAAGLLLRTMIRADPRHVLSRARARVGAARHAIPCAVLAALTVLGVLQWPASLGATPTVAGMEAVIRSGQERLLADILGQGASLPGGCAFAGGRVEGAAVVATYRCAHDEVRIELRHPSAAPPDARRTVQFALTVGAGAPPPALIEALESRIRAREDRFAWSWQPVIPKEPDPPPLPRVAAALVVLGLAAAAWRMRRHGQRAARSLGRYAARRGGDARRRAAGGLAAGAARVADLARRTGRGVRARADRVRRDPRGALRTLVRDERTWVAAALIVSAIARGWLALVNRSSADDHALVAHLIRRNGWEPPPASACWTCSHAKLYHYVLAVAYEYIAQGPDASLLIGNLVNFVAGTVVLVLLYVYARRQPVSPTVRVLAVAYMSLNPALVSIFSQTTNDGFCILFSSLAIFFLARFLTDRALGQALAATVFIVLAALSKATGWAIFAAGAAVAVIAVGAAAAPLRKRYAVGAALFVLGFLAIVPLMHPYRQNIAARHSPFVNDEFKTPVMENEVPRDSAAWVAHALLSFRLVGLLREPYLDYHLVGPAPAHRESLWSQVYGKMFFLRFDRGIWYSFDPRSLWLGRVCLLLALLPLAALGIGAAQVTVSTIRGVTAHGRRWLIEYLDWQHVVYAGVMMASLAAVIVAYHRLATAFLWMKAVYLLPGILSFFALFLLGLERAWRRSPRVVTVWMLALTIAAMVDVAWLLRDVTSEPRDERHASVRMVVSSRDRAIGVVGADREVVDGRKSVAFTPGRRAP
jgi:hypothetical protein